MIRRPPRSTLFPTRRSSDLLASEGGPGERFDASGVDLRGIAPPAQPRRQPEMTAGAHEQSHAVGVQELVRRVDRVVDNLGFGRGLQQAPTKSLQGGVVRGLKRQAV